MGLLDGKKAAIFGVANDRSIAWAIAEAFHAEGAELAFTFAGEILEKRVRPLAEGIGSKIILPCDVTKDEEVEKVFATLKQEWGGLDILVHAIAFAVFFGRARTASSAAYGRAKRFDRDPDVYGFGESHSQL